MLLARLAVDQKHEGQGNATRMLIEALERALRASQAIGAVAVEVHAKDEDARRFYTKFGFRNLDHDLHLWLPSPATQYG